MGTFLMKLYTKKEKKLSGSFWEINILSEKLTTTDDDGRRTTDDGRRRKTDESALEKLRCLSAGGAKNSKWEVFILSKKQHPLQIPGSFSVYDWWMSRS